MTEHMSRHQFQTLQAKPAKRQKYNAKRVLLDGIVFDSKAEASYYAHLKLRERAGEVTDVELQRPYAFVYEGVLLGTYRADFVFWDNATRRRRVVDVKGVATPMFRQKQKMMKAFHKIEVETVK